MAEGLVMQVAFSVCEQSANQMDSQREDVSNQISEYCKELLMRGAIEFSFEELRAERYQQQKKKEMTERLNHLIKVNAQMCQEVQEKERLLQLRKSEQPQVLTDTANAATTTTTTTSTSSSSSTDPSVAQVVHGASTSQSSDSARSPAAASSQINDESQSQPATATWPAGKGESSPRELLDDVFLCPDERGLCLKAHCSQPDHHGGTSEDLQSLVHSQPSFMPQQSVSKAPKELSPIQETSVEAASWTSLPGLSSGSCSLLEAEQKHRDQDHAPSPASENILLVAEPVGGAMDPCDPDVRRRLLEPCDVTSSPACHSDPRPLPAVEESGVLQLGGVVYLLFSRVHDGGSFSVYRGTSDEGQVLIKVDSCSLPWDFHQFNRLKKNCSTPDSLPLLSCFVFLDGCITVYTAPPGHRFTALTKGTPELSVTHEAVWLLQLVSQLHACRLVHAALRPDLLTCSSRGVLGSGYVFPVDWSSSVDLDLQQNVTSVQQLCSAQTYISLGLLEPTAPPHLVDLVGIAETVHLLLTNSSMVLVKDDEGWTAEQFSGNKPCYIFSHMWRRFFRLLLNAGDRSSLTVLSELKEQMSALP